MTKPRDTDEQLLTGYAGRLAVLLALGWSTLLLGRQVLPPLLPTIIDAFEISPSRAGFALTLLLSLYALLQYPAGRLSDTLSRITVLMASIGGMLVGFAALFTATSYPGLLLGSALLGIGSAFYFTPSRAYLSDLFVERRGQAFGMMSMAGLAAGALAAGLAVVAIRVATWQAAFLLPMAILGFVGVGLHVASDEPYVLRGSGLNLDLRGTLDRLIGRPRLRRLIVMRSFVTFPFQAMIAFLPAFLQFEKGLSTTAASVGFALFFVAGAVSAPASGWLSDRVARLRVVLGCVALALGALAALLFVSGTLAVLATTLVLAVGMMAMLPVLQAYLFDQFPDGNLGGDYGAAKTIFTGAGSLGPTYLGVLVTAVGYTTAFASLGVFLFVAAALIVTLRRDE